MATWFKHQNQVTVPMIDTEQAAVNDPPTLVAKFCLRIGETE